MIRTIAVLVPFVLNGEAAEYCTSDFVSGSFNTGTGTNKFLLMRQPGLKERK